MRISDWSSDVCSSDLSVIAVPDPKWGERPLAVIVAKADAIPTLEIINAPVERAIASGAITRYAKPDRFRIVDQIGRAPCRERVCPYVSISEDAVLLIKNQQQS